MSARARICTACGGEGKKLLSRAANPGGFATISKAPCGHCGGSGYEPEQETPPRNAAPRAGRSRERGSESGTGHSQAVAMRPSSAGPATVRLTAHEIEALRMIAGEIALPGRAWITAAIESLKGNGLIEGEFAFRLTEKGQGVLTNLHSARAVV